MLSPSIGRYPLVISLLPRLLLVVILVSSQFTRLLTPPAAAAPAADLIESVEDFLSLGRNTVKELEKAIDQATGNVQVLLKQLRDDINGLIKTIEETYQRNVNYTLNGLNDLTSGKLLQLQLLINTVNETLRETIDYTTAAFEQLIRDASTRIRILVQDVEKSLQNVIFAATTSGVYFVDRTTNNVIAVISIVMLGLGLLLFIWLLVTQRLPKGLAQTLVFLFGITYLLLFSAMGFVPPARTYAMTFSGVGLEQRLEPVAPQPRIFSAFPGKIILSETREVDLLGSTLSPQGKMPTAKIANQPVPVIAVTNEEVVVSVADLNAPVGSTSLVLAYDGGEETGTIVYLDRPAPPPKLPDLEITSFTIDPPSPIQDRNTKATITVHNRGEGPSGPFVVLLRPQATQEVGPSVPVPSLNIDESRSLTIDYSYLNIGTFDTVAIVDVFFYVSEKDENNNSLTKKVTVILPTALCEAERARLTALLSELSALSTGGPPPYKCDQVPGLCDAHVEKIEKWHEQHDQEIAQLRSRLASPECKP